MKPPLGSSPPSATFISRSPTGSPPLAPAAFLIWAAVTARWPDYSYAMTLPPSCWTALPTSCATARDPGRCGAIALCRWLGAVAALWMLYYVPEPSVVLAEARRVLRTGGVFVACTSSRYNDPEFAEAMPGWGEPFSFDAETAVDIVAEQFSINEVQRWDTAVVRLPDVAAVRLFLRGRGLSETAAASEAARRRCPLSVTKRGCLIWARN